VVRWVLAALIGTLLLVCGAEEPPEAEVASSVEEAEAIEQEATDEEPSVDEPGAEAAEADTEVDSAAGELDVTAARANVVVEAGWRALAAQARHR
jgi:hypothetical protein